MEVVDESDVVGDQGLGKEHDILFFDGGGQTVNSGVKITKAEEEFGHGLVACFVGGLALKVILPVV